MCALRPMGVTGRPATLHSIATAGGGIARAASSARAARRGGALAPARDRHTAALRDARAPARAAHSSRAVKGAAQAGPRRVLIPAAPPNF